MLSRNQAKHVQSLKLPRFRKEHGQFIAEGVKIAEEILDSSYTISGVFALASWLDIHVDGLKKRDIRFQEVDAEELERISQLKTPNEVLMVVDIPKDAGDDPLLPDLTLYLDRIQDPGNMGTIIRTADWFGAGLVVCSPGCADLYNPKVIQATMGSFTRIRVVEREGSGFLQQAAGQALVCGAVAGGEDIYSFGFSKPAVVVIGNESQGISADLIPFLNKKIGIPRFNEKVESLNAAVAAAIICSEFRRRE